MPVAFTPLESAAVEPALAELKDRLGEITDLRRATNVLYWDQHGDDAGLGERSARRPSSPRSRRSCKSDSSRTGSASSSTSSSPTRSRSRTTPTTRASSGRAARLGEGAPRSPRSSPPSSRRRSADAYEVWVTAREDSDFELFRPSLERMLELRLRYVECFAPYDDPYDVLLDDYEPGMRAEEVREDLLSARARARRARG